jgi:putative ABC transport system permease protein
MARLNFSGVLNNGRTDVPVVGVGVEPDKEARLGTSTVVVSGRQLRATDRYQIVLGEGVANATKLGPGDRATILTSTADGALNTLDFEIVGTFRSFSKDYDARTVRIPLAAARELLDVDAANAIVATLNETEATASVIASLKARLPGDRFEVKAWDELADFYGKTEALYQRQFAVLQAIILVAVLLSVANSVNMSTYERTGEFGTLMAMGSRRRTVMRQVLTENLMLGVLGGMVGALAGTLLASGISAIGIPMPPPPNSNVGYTAAIRVVPRVVAAAAVISVVATVAAALIPAWRVTRLPVVDALRRNQ